MSRVWIAKVLTAAAANPAIEWLFHSEEACEVAFDILRNGLTERRTVEEARTVTISDDCGFKCAVEMAAVVAVEMFALDEVRRRNVLLADESARAEDMHQPTYRRQVGVAR